MKTVKSALTIFFILFITLSIFSVFESASATTYTYNIFGPLNISNSASSSDTVALTILWSNHTTKTFDLSTGSSFSGSSSYYIQQITWNFSTSLNYTGCLAYADPYPTTTSTIYIYAEDTTQMTSAYTFTVIDFAGISNAYLSVSNKYGNTNPIVLQQADLNTTAAPTFILEQYKPYILTITCDQGTYLQDFYAGTTYTQSLPINKGFFPEATNGLVTATATRTNSTYIQIYYDDPADVTTLLDVSVSHVEGGVYSTDWSTLLASTNTLSMGVPVDNSTDYTVTIAATRNGEIQTWQISCPALLTITNPLSGLFDWLGTWPDGLDPAQLLAAGIIICCLCVGSFRSAGFSCILAWIATGILMAIGLFSMGIPLFAFAGVLSFIVVLNEAKETTREV